MTLQETFNYVVAHLIKQQVPAIGTSQICMYRAENGMSCAVGCLIPDHLYTDEIENYPASRISEVSAEIGEYLGLSNQHMVYMLCELQHLHDQWFGCSDVEREGNTLAAIANQFGLVFDHAAYEDQRAAFYSAKAAQETT